MRIGRRILAVFLAAWLAAPPAGAEPPAPVVGREALDEALRAEFPPERRAFTAHLTVARSDPPIALPAAFAEGEVRSEPFRVSALVLYRSHLQRPAPRYEPLRSFPLSGR